MKKHITIILALVCAAALFGGCLKKTTYESTEVENVSISISNVSSAGATIIIKDLNKAPYLYGEWYRIEKEKNGEWYEVETVINNYGFDEVGHLPDKNGEVKFEVDWKWLYGELSAGHYRLLKRVDSQHISVDFHVGAAASQQ